MKCTIINVDFTGNIGILTTNQSTKDKYNTGKQKFSPPAAYNTFQNQKCLFTQSRNQSTLLLRFLARQDPRMQLAKGHECAIYCVSLLDRTRVCHSQKVTNVQFTAYAIHKMLQMCILPHFPAIQDPRMPLAKDNKHAIYRDSSLNGREYILPCGARNSR